ncbi:Metallo-beta-lactamase superfamily protein [Variovorax sp. YR752]|uniref:MBL fold metallo-hydrolase n=1 Tax=Variovorax sp. YR752 TaxID=1884383 RepID=UPI000BD8DBAD|nr:MBL fold metallo-hydrolase [Variovorax sp. YR752]SOD24101.1 Metallo-beta-lactamase superfamily protein [Variovorax sp. YR752]
MVTKREFASTVSAEVAAFFDDTRALGEYHFLDVGDQQYGECIVVIFGDVRILIDGSHQGDFRGRNGHKSIPDQLAEIFREPAPHRISMVVVTHGHADHIGCLPDLVSNDVIVPEWAFITDPQMGFGRDSQDAIPHDALSDPSQRLVAALREEDASGLSDGELRDFIDAAASVESRYADFIAHLKEKRTKIVLNIGEKLPAELLRLLRPTGFTFLGPTQEQLLLCWNQIAKTNKDAKDAADALLRADATLDEVSLYREIVSHDPKFDDSTDSGGRGNGMNCQSITLAFGPKNERVLLAGDMQFAEPGVKGADDEMARLRESVVRAGPYKVFKTTHHTSHNGQDDDFLTKLGDPPIIVHSGGINDPSHPYPSVLELLKGRRSTIKFARTDRNGHIIVRPHLDVAEAIEKSSGRLNDFSDNVKDMESMAEPAGNGPAAQATFEQAQPISQPVSQPISASQVIIINLPAGLVDMTVAGVEIVVRAPRDDRSVARTSGWPTPPAPDRPQRGGGRIRQAADFRFAGGRNLPSLLFVTNANALAKNIGSAETDKALSAIRAAGHDICEVDGSAPDAVNIVRGRLSSKQSTKGVVLLGGYDVVPCNVVNVLSPSLGAALGSRVIEIDDDHFIVWSDELYGDVDEDRVGEIPVSRIPDGRDSVAFLNALAAPGVNGGGIERFGVRNIARPFAETAWGVMAGRRSLNVSEAFLTSDAEPEHLDSALHYFMLHGDWRDGRTFYGELGNQAGYTNAFAVGNVPKQASGVIFSGCCWGALTVSQRAKDAGAAPIAPRVVERSIALSYLMAGASAFVGCTGAHYSGANSDPNVNYAALMHRSFWSELPTRGYSASSALHFARQAYSADLAERADSLEPVDLARRLKNRSQFTCLGLGW